MKGSGTNLRVFFWGKVLCDRNLDFGFYRDYGKERKEFGFFSFKGRVSELRYVGVRPSVSACVFFFFSFLFVCLFFIFLLITNWIGNREKEIIRIIIG